jgi:general secretion pathway protein G
VENRPCKRMKPLTNRRWDGVLSLVWFCGGFFALKIGDFHPDSPVLNFFIVFGAWWGVAVLLAVSGLRSRYWPSVVTSLGTVLVFICFFWMIRPRVTIWQPPARMAAAMTQIATFKTALDAFEADTGSYPTGRDGLQALLKQPLATTNWQGPYLNGIPKDPWGQDYHYECPGRQNTNSYDISSPGPPRQNAPIANWARPSLKP